MEELAVQDKDLVIGAPKHCSAGSGASWIATAWRLFKENWLEFLVAFVILFVLGLALSQMRVVSMLFSLLIDPVLTAGFLVMAHKAWRDEDPQIADIVSGFRRSRRGKWAKVVLLKLLVSLILVVALGLLGVAFFLTAQHTYVGFEGMALFHESMTHPQLWMLWFVAALLLMLVFFSCAMWLAMPLAWFTSVGVVDSLRLSLQAAGRNAGALTVLGLLLFLLMVLAVIPIGLGLLVVMPMAAITTYVAFRQIFVD